MPTLWSAQMARRCVGEEAGRHVCSICAHNNHTSSFTQLLGEEVMMWSRHQLELALQTAASKQLQDKRIFSAGQSHPLPLSLPHPSSLHSSLPLSNKALYKMIIIIITRPERHALGQPCTHFVQTVLRMVRLGHEGLSINQNCSCCTWTTDDHARLEP